MGHYSWKQSFRVFDTNLTGLRESYRLQKMSFRILVGIYYHNIPTHNP